MFIINVVKSMLCFEMYAVKVSQNKILKYKRKRYLKKSKKNDKKILTITVQHRFRASCCGC